MQNLIFFFLMFPISAVYALTLSPTPEAVFYTPDSIIHHLSPAWLQNVGNRSRFSTCTGVAWFTDNNHLVSANLLECSMQTYLFNADNKTITAQKKYGKDVSKLGWPENLTISNDGRLLAVSNSATGKVIVYRINPKTNYLNPVPAAYVEAGDSGLHGLRFSPDGQYLAYVTYDGMGKVRFFRVSSTYKKLSFDLISSVACTFEDMSSKGIDFSHDMKYVAVCYSTKIRSDSTDISGKLAVFRFDKDTGVMEAAPLCVVGTDEFLSTPEDVIFSSDDTCILVTNQGNDTISAHSFDTASGLIYDNRVILKSPEAELNFPHGMALSSNGKHLAVSNYGDDKICIYSAASD